MMILVSEIMLWGTLGLYSCDSLFVYDPALMIQYLVFKWGQVA